MVQKLSLKFLYSCMIVYVIAGAGNAIVLKLQDNFRVGDQKFKHVFFQTYALFIGKLICILMFLYQKYNLQKEKKNIEKDCDLNNEIEVNNAYFISSLLLIIPMLLESLGTIFFLIAIIHLPASITLMICSIIVFVVAVMSIIFLNRTLYRHNWTGIFLIFIGINK